MRLGTWGVLCTRRMTWHPPLRTSPSAAGTWEPSAGRQVAPWYGFPWPSEPPDPPEERIAHRQTSWAL